MEKKPKIKIFVAHHKQWYVYEDDVYVPIQVWKKNAKVDLWILWDDTWDNISWKNDNYAELTAQYRVWKNYDLRDIDYVWFCHYRRYMTYYYKPNLWKYIFTKNPYNPWDARIWQIRALHEWLCIFNYNENMLHENKKNLVDYVINNKNDLYTAKRAFFIKWNICKIIWIPTDSFFDFCFGCFWQEYLSLKKRAKEIFLQMYPDYKDIIKYVQEECKCYFPLYRHLFIMRTDLFLDYVKWLFDYLFEVEKYMDKHHIQTEWIYGGWETRFMWIFSEVFINYWKLYMERNKWLKTSSKSNLIFFEN